jgi:uroporphyrinogen-III synthase
MNFLAGRHIIILRHQEQAKPLFNKVLKYKGKPYVVPILEAVPLNISLDNEISEILQDAKMVIVVSANAVIHTPLPLIRILQSTHTSKQILSMGSATSKILKHNDIKIFFTAPPGSTSETLLEQDFLADTAIRGNPVVLLAGEGGRTVLADALQQRGAKIDWIKTYSLQSSSIALSPLYRGWQNHWCCFVAMSNRTIENLLALTPDNYLDWLKKCLLVVISPRLQQQASEWGFQHVLVATSAEPEAIIQVLRYHLMKIGTDR